MYLLLSLLLLTSCQSQPSAPLQTTIILGRSDSHTLSTREPIYRLQTPTDWKLTQPSETASLIDTTEPLLTLTHNDVTITFHNFPVKTIQQRIAPAAQIARWKKQFEQLEPTSVHLNSFSTAGFVGIQFEGTGVQKGIPVSVHAWSMQLTPELFQKLPEGAIQDKADWTLKAVGPPDQLELLQEDLQTIAKSVELIREIPSR